MKESEGDDEDLRNRCFWYSVSFSSYFRRQHRTRGLRKLMNYSHRDQDSMCTVHYPTSHNTKLFEFIELWAEFSHTDLTQLRIILRPLSLKSRWQCKVLLIFVRLNYHKTFIVSKSWLCSLMVKTVELLNNIRCLKMFLGLSQEKPSNLSVCMWSLSWARVKSADPPGFCIVM